MAARTKRRAKFDFRGRPFVWWIDGDQLLRISSFDKRFVVALELVGATDTKARLQVIGQEFPGDNTGRARPFVVDMPSFVQPSMGATVDAVLSYVFGSSRRPGGVG